ncbi:hypothetical protein WJX72_011493 [[Myrmecia] bisecta]|uniref:Tryptophan synthase beta chain-like PALP domain-containing protein n=1 Tax=[Myrmecia] bisecta TaxID=41462 RepID=A0AAW1PIG9_9CHLO
MAHSSVMQRVRLSKDSLHTSRPFTGLRRVTPCSLGCPQYSSARQLHSRVAGASGKGYRQVTSMKGSGKFLVGGNWKCNGTVDSVRKLVADLNGADVPSDIDIVVAPTFLHLGMAKDQLKGPYQLAAQNSWVGKGGAFTGEVSAEMLTDFGIPWVILGHSERRSLIDESNEFVGEKTAYALSQGLKVIACIGETLQQREANQVFEVLDAQLTAIADTIADWENVVIAYEPVWAIGTGKVASPEQAQAVHAHIRQWFEEKVTPEVANSIRIIYGGSVNDSNASNLAGQEDIDGFLLSLDIRSAAALHPSHQDKISSRLRTKTLLKRYCQERGTVKAEKVEPVGSAGSAFWIVRDDLLHPVIQANKMRKLDSLLPKLIQDGATDVVTCGGVQSAHTAAVAAACAENGLRAHLLIRGERPAVPTGHYLLALMYGNVVHVTRSEYSNREAMFERHVAKLKEKLPAMAKVAVIKEGAAEPLGMLGFIRLVNDLSTSSGGIPSTRWVVKDGKLHRRQPQLNIVIDSGTGASAIGVALGIAYYRLPWQVTGVMLAGDTAYYQQQQASLLAAFLQEFRLEHLGQLPIKWVDRPSPRRFGKVLSGDIDACKKVAKQHGILLDPIYTLAAWEVAQQLAANLPPLTSRTDQEVQQQDPDLWHSCEALWGRNHHEYNPDKRPIDELDDLEIVMVHSGGTMGLNGLAQRFPEQF